ncbi:hypothetical protein G7K_6421-t1 [Saitoella complicata NRRL Y-17804]|uniref:Uncharacterized protein n=1 Tax=Saitoella complicata (strain BCRC 22490 / CBS 7301 / JCM 7358 / NBRC 10748 / NRRL Y-17804) TaxID=698492 RepID=A0A0E9NRB0_SAICN|nr:hypothetical protein G7K_6421-t1 [Saitoella complicata NRRL Y-17804]
MAAIPAGAAAAGEGTDGAGIRGELEGKLDMSDGVMEDPIISILAGRVSLGSCLVLTSRAVLTTFTSPLTNRVCPRAQSPMSHCHCRRNYNLRPASALPYYLIYELNSHAGGDVLDERAALWAWVIYTKRDGTRHVMSEHLGVERSPWIMSHVLPYSWDMVQGLNHLMLSSCMCISIHQEGSQ